MNEMCHPEPCLPAGRLSKGDQLIRNPSHFDKLSVTQVMSFPRKRESHEAKKIPHRVRNDIDLLLQQ